jgi:hypothetical protein
VGIQRRFGVLAVAAILPTVLLLAGCGGSSSASSQSLGPISASSEEPGSQPPASEPASGPPASAAAPSSASAMRWTGTMSGTETWTGQGAQVSASATFTGSWDPVPNDGQAQPCTPGIDTCLAFYPHGSIDWTWQSTITTPPCTAKTGATTPAGAGNTPASAIFGETLYLQPDDAGNYTYCGTGTWLPPQMSCPEADVSVPPEYFDIPQTASGGAPTSDSLCHAATWQIVQSATSISGSCYGFNQPSHSLKFSWSLTRSSP